MFYLILYFLLAILDYFLAFQLETLYSNGIDKYFEYEAEFFTQRQLWRRDIHKFKRISFLHLATVFLTTAILVIIAFRGPRLLFDAAIGFYLIPQVYFIGSQISSLLHFRYILKNPGCITGKLFISKYNSIFAMLEIFIPLLFLALFLRLPVLWGGLCGLIWQGIRIGISAPAAKPQ